MALVISVPDLHEPYSDPDGVSALFAKIEEIQKRRKVDYVVQLGDSLDMYSFSKFPRSHNILTPKQELEQGRDAVWKFWKTIQTICPEATKYQLVGNHEERLPKRILDRLPEAESLFSVKDLFTHPNCEVVEGDLVIDDVLYIHGYLTRQYAHLRYFLRSVVFGHTHNAWIVYEKIDALIGGRTPHKNGLLFEMTCGFLGDQSQIPLQYTASKKNKWALGFGVVEDGVPSFIPL